MNTHTRSTTEHVFHCDTTCTWCSGCKLAIQEYLQYKENLTLPAPYCTIRNSGRRGIVPKAAPQSLHARVSIYKIMNLIQNLIVQSGTLILKIYFDVKQSFGMLLCKFILAALTRKKVAMYWRSSFCWPIYLLILPSKNMQ